MTKSLKLEDLEAIVIDFDGVLTDNGVYVLENGQEAVKCSRSDGLAFDVLRKKKKPRLFIYSTETNPVVQARAKKLKVTCTQSVADKEKGLQDLASKENFDLKKTIYIGNDLNDYKAMLLCGYSACPSDSHPAILKIASFPLKTKGGQGVMRELVEGILSIDIIKELTK